jgi:hypothetical protein
MTELDLLLLLLLLLFVWVLDTVYCDLLFNMGISRNVFTGYRNDLWS